MIIKRNYVNGLKRYAHVYSFNLARAKWQYDLFSDKDSYGSKLANFLMWRLTKEPYHYDK